MREEGPAGKPPGDFPETKQMEVNPLMVLDEGRGARAVDVRMRMKKA
ncbi:MAG: hypothetical protein P8Y66_09785 [Nitrospirota bacterium]